MGRYTSQKLDLNLYRGNHSIDRLMESFNIKMQINNLPAFGEAFLLILKQNSISAKDLFEEILTELLESKPELKEIEELFREKLLSGIRKYVDQENLDYQELKLNDLVGNSTYLIGESLTDVPNQIIPANSLLYEDFTLSHDNRELEDITTTLAELIADPNRRSYLPIYVESFIKQKGIIPENLDSIVETIEHEVSEYLDNEVLLAFQEQKEILINHLRSRFPEQLEERELPEQSYLDIDITYLDILSGNDSTLRDLITISEDGTLNVKQEIGAAISNLLSSINTDPTEQNRIFKLILDVITSDYSKEAAELTREQIVSFYGQSRETQTDSQTEQLPLWKRIAKKILK